jgi:hypothetical protein
MQRRTFVRSVVIGSAAVAVSGCARADVRTFPTLASAQSALDALQKQPKRTSQGWKLPAVLVHAAQSVEYSLTGFPEMKPAWFRASAGTLAFAVFDAKGSMHHSLTEPIPGAPALGEPALEAAVQRLQKALRDFEVHRGTLAPHFAYGALDHAQYARAHLMHLANHWEDVIPA